MVFHGLTFLDAIGNSIFEHRNPAFCEGLREEVCARGGCMVLEKN